MKQLIVMLSMAMLGLAIAASVLSFEPVAETNVETTITEFNDVVD